MLVVASHAGVRCPYWRIAIDVSESRAVLIDIYVLDIPASCFPSRVKSSWSSGSVAGSLCCIASEMTPWRRR